MAVVDRWHRSRKSPESGDICREHGLLPSPQHGRGDRWQVRYRDDTGKQRKRNFPKKAGADPNTCASAFAAKIADQLNRDAYIDPGRGKVQLRTYAEQWRAALTCDPATVMQIRSRLNVHVYPKIGDVSMGVLAKRPSLVQQWIKGLERDLSASTIKGIVGWVSTIFKAAVDDGVVARNPFDAGSVRRPRVQATKAVPWDLAQVFAISRSLPARFRAMAWLGAGCGHRQGELFGVGLDDVDFLGRVVHVRRQVRIVDGTLVFSLPKGGKQRSVPLPDSVGLRLSAHIAEHGTTSVTLPWRVAGGDPVTVGLLFTVGAEALDRNDFNRIWRSARAAAGIADTRNNGMHALRHTAASAWLAAGVDIRTVAEYMGHTDPGFTLRTYTHLMPDAADRARKAMDVFFEVGAGSALDVPSGGAR